MKCGTVFLALVGSFLVLAMSEPGQEGIDLPGSRHLSGPFGEANGQVTGADPTGLQGYDLLWRSVDGGGPPS